MLTSDRPIRCHWVHYPVFPRNRKCQIASSLFNRIASDLSNELDNTTSLSDLALSLGADVPGTDNDGDLGETAWLCLLVLSVDCFRSPIVVLVLTLAEELGIAVGEEVDNGGRVGLGAANVLVAGFNGDERPTVPV